MLSVLRSKLRPQLAYMMGTAPFTVSDVEELDRALAQTVPIDRLIALGMTTTHAKLKQPAAEQGPSIGRGRKQAKASRGQHASHARRQEGSM